MKKIPRPTGRPAKPKPELPRDAAGNPVKYGVTWPRHLTEVEIELLCFRDGWSREDGGLGKYGHLKKAIQLVWPDLEWHEWMEWRLKKVCEYSINAWTGCGASGKSFDSILYAMIWWLALPAESSVILTSTTGKMIKKRLWPIVTELFDKAAVIPGSILGAGFPGNMVDSKTMLQVQRGDEKHGIFMIAVDSGPTHKAVADIQGIHSRRMLVIIDEATDTPEAIFAALPNLSKGCEEFTLIINGNADSHVNPHGRICEPVAGWASVNVETDEWETKGVSEWEIGPGVCLHFDGLKSPNIKAGFWKHPWLYSQKDLESARSGEDFQETVRWWKYTRGFWAPDGICKTVFTEALFAKHDARGKHIWISKIFIIAGFDPAFGGDRPILRFAELGDMENGLMGIQCLMPIIEIPLLVAKGNEIHYQLADRVQAECVKRGVSPEHFAMDTSGEGGGTADIISRQWSPNIVRVEFGGAPSEMPVSKEDNRPANVAFDRKVTELYFSARNFVFGSQLKGVTDRDIAELTSREYEEKLRKKKLDTKDDCKAKIGKSPDYADSLVVLCHLARQLGAIAGGDSTPGTDKNWEAMVRKADEINAEEGFSSVVATYADLDW